MEIEHGPAKREIIRVRTIRDAIAILSGLVFEYPYVFPMRRGPGKKGFSEYWIFTKFNHKMPIIIDDIVIERLVRHGVLERSGSGSNLAPGCLVLKKRYSILARMNNIIRAVAPKYRLW